MEQIFLEKYILNLIELTRNGQGDSDRHLMSLFSIALASKGKTLLELGVRDGTTTLPLLLAAALNQGTLYSVDINETSFKCPPELTTFWRFTKSDSIKFLESWNSKNKIDVVYIDDWHAYEHVKEELKLISKLTTPSSIILLHDLMYGGTEPRYHSNPAMHKGEWAYGGPFRAVKKLNQSGWEWITLPWASGLTILRKKTPDFIESRIKIWSKRMLKRLAPRLERKLVQTHQKLKNHNNEQ